MFKVKIADKENEEGGISASMLLRATYTMDPNDYYTPAEHRNTYISDALLNQGMDDLELEDEKVGTDFCFKYIGLQE